MRDELVDAIPIGLKKRVELARALVAEPSFLILDEPMAGMNQEEKEYMARFILDARDERGVTVLLIEHHMDVVTGICDRMLVLSYGEMIGTGMPRDVIADPRVVEAYLGGAQCRAPERRIAPGTSPPNDADAACWRATRSAFPDRVAMREKNNGIWQETTWRGVARQRASHCAAGLESAGFRCRAT